AIIAGDFNAVPESETIQVFREEWRVAGWRDDEECLECGPGKAEGGRRKAEGGSAEGATAVVEVANPSAVEVVPILTFPAEKPDKWIDYVMVRPADAWEVVEVRVLDDGVASDHRPVL